MPSSLVPPTVKLAQVDPATAPHRLRKLPSWLLSQTALAAARLVNEALADAGITNTGARRAHYSLLAALDEFGPASQAELSQRCGIYRSDLVAVLNELQAAHLVRRAPDPADARRNIVTLTQTGADQLRHLDAVLTTVQDELLAPLTPSERAQLVTLLSRVLDRHGG
jgi:DNA-binding MarR family transcriptional regulator